MILVVASVWIEHFRKADATLTALLTSRVVMCYPFLVGGRLSLWTNDRRLEAVAADRGVAFAATTN